MAGRRRALQAALACAGLVVGFLGPAATAGATSAPVTAAAVGLTAGAPEGTAAVLDTAVGVRTVDYDLGTDVEPLAGIPDARGELRGRLYLPAGATTASPVVVFLHGQHQVCVRDDDSWPCAAGGAIPSYLGYAEPASALAARGIAVVSVSANAINAFDGGSTDYGARARGQLILDTLDVLAAATSPAGSAGFPADLRGTLDLSRVGLMGHSRGGEGVVRAVQLNAVRPDPYPIKAVMPLAPAPFLGLSMPGVVTAVLAGYCDSDTGQQIVDASRSAFDDSVLRSTLLVMGANHNFFNSVWSPGGYPVGGQDDAVVYDDDAANAPVCGTGAATRLSQQQQRAVQSGYLTALFRLTLLGDQQFLPLFDGSAAPTPLPDPFDGTDPAAFAALSAADVRVTAHAAHDARVDLAPLTDPATELEASGATGTTAVICAGTTGATVAPVPACSALGIDQLPHWSPVAVAQAVPLAPMAHLSWSAPGGVITIPINAAAQDISAMDTLDLAMAPDDTVVGATAADIEVVDAQGRVATLDPALLAPALTVLPGSAPSLRKVLLRGVRVPLATLTGIDLRAVTEIRVRPGTDAGGLYLSDIAAGTAGTAGAAGAPGVPSAPSVPSLPVLSLRATSVQQTGVAQQTRLAAVLDRATDHPVTAWTVGTLQMAQDVSQDYQLARRIEIPAGQRCVAVTLPLPASGPDAGVASLATAMTLLTGAVPDTLFAATSVRPDGPSEIPDVGVQGDVCAEALAGPVPLRIAAGPTAGTVTVTADGYRAKESVTIGGLPGAAPITFSAPDGTVDLDLDIIALAAGTYPLTAVGAGSGRQALGDLVVAAPPPTSTGPTSTGPTSTGPTSTSTSTSTEPTVSSLPEPTPAPVVPTPWYPTGDGTGGGAGGDGTAGTAGTSAYGTTRPAGTLAATGVDPAGPLTAALVALAAGVPLLILGRRPLHTRRTRRQS